MNFDKEDLKRINSWEFIGLKEITPDNWLPMFFDKVINLKVVVGLKEHWKMLEENLSNNKDNISYFILHAL